MGDGIALNDSVLTSNVDSVITLNITNQNISDLTGIEDFTQLRILNVNFNQITSIDVSNIIFETIVLEAPKKRVHPGIKDGSLKSEILDKLEDLKPKELFLNKRDPRWDKLKELL